MHVHTSTYYILHVTYHIVITYYIRHGAYTYDIDTYTCIRICICKYKYKCIYHSPLPMTPVVHTVLRAPGALQAVKAAPTEKKRQLATQKAPLTAEDGFDLGEYSMVPRVSHCIIFYFVVL